MAEALVSGALNKLGSIMDRELEQGVRLVVGVEEEVRKLKSNLTAIQAMLADAETRQVKEAIVRDWLEKLKEVAYDIEDVLDDWEVAILDSQSKPGDEQDPQRSLQKVRSALESTVSGVKQVGPRHDLAKRIEGLNGELDLLAQQKERYQFVPRESNPPIERSITTSFIDRTEVKGREKDNNVLLKKLLSEPSGGDGSDLRVLSIVGPGGMGKTTLAQFAFNHNRVEAYFDRKIWVCVSDPFDEIKVAEAILESISRSAPGVRQLQSLLEEIRESIWGRKFLLVLDDVWEENSKKWDPLKECLKSGSSGSKILVTTRKSNVASNMRCLKNDIFNLKGLSDEECWLILSEKAFFDREVTERKNLESVGRKISKKCRGLPLAAKTLGGILRFKKRREEWESILNSELWKVEEAQRGILGPLLLSYHELSPALKRCFSYCAIFPKDYEMNKRELIGLWMAQGYLGEEGSDNLEVIGEDYFQHLAMRSLFQNFKYFYDTWMSFEKKSYKMHDMVHDLAQLLVRGECLSIKVKGPVGSESRKVRHLGLECTVLSSCSLYSSESFLNSSDPKKLRSLLIRGSRLTTEELSRLFSESTRVRSLGLRRCNFPEIPPSIRKLVRLRWLDLSHNPTLQQLPETLCELHSLQTIDVSSCPNLRQLPETLCELHNLQTIDVSWCPYLRLPLGIGNLINLKHLNNYNWGPPTRLPKGIGELIGLRTLGEVYVGYGDDNEISLVYLKKLNQLRGNLAIKGLGANERHVGAARQAELKQKEHITGLSLEFKFWLEASESPPPPNLEELLLLEALEPPPNLESLEIKGYNGTSYPAWMISLTNLRAISLMNCDSLKHLPSMGKLPCLETLYLCGMSGVKKVGKELLGIETQIGERKSEISASSASSSSSSPAVVAFPKLKILEFVGMENWEEWEDYYNDNYDGTTKPPPIIIMPSLLSLKIYTSSELKALPDYILQNTKLRKLQIMNNHLLEERYNKKTGKDRSKISHNIKFEFSFVVPRSW